MTAMAQQKILYSVVVPVHCEAATLPDLCDRVERVFAQMGCGDRFEMLVVDDGSTDDTPLVLQQLAKERRYVRYITFRRNFGKALALMAGFQYVNGNVLITMDGDLQDNPEDIPAFLSKLNEGYDLACGWRRNRADKSSRKIGSKIFNATVALTTGLGIHDINCGFKAYRAEVVRAICIYGHYHRYIPVLAHLVGFKVGEVSVVNSERKYGSSKYSTFRYQGFFDLLSILFIHKYGLSPLHFFGTASMALLIPSTAELLYLLSQFILFLLGHNEGYVPLNRPLLLLSLVGILVGVIIFFTGFVCDFILHHQIRGRINEILAVSIAERSDGKPEA